MYVTDFAAVSNQRIDYYGHGVLMVAEKISLKYVNSIIYDGDSNRMLIVNFSTQILSYDREAGEAETLVYLKDYTKHSIKSIAYDPIEQILYWIDAIQRTINWFSLKPGAKNEANGKVLTTLDVDKPVALAVDSCKG